MYDANGSSLHPNEHGYQVWADAIIGKVLELMNLPPSATQPVEK